MEKHGDGEGLIFLVKHWPQSWLDCPKKFVCLSQIKRNWKSMVYICLVAMETGGGGFHHFPLFLQPASLNLFNIATF